MGGRVIKLEDSPFGQDWHPAFMVSPRFTDHGDGTVTDNLTGLIWLKNANCIADNIGFDEDGNVSWQQGLDFVKGVNSGSYDCGDTSNNGGPQTDWRLPNVYELYSLTDPSQTNPALSPDHPFLGMDSGSYWSSTTAYYTEIKDAAGYVEFAIARLYYYVKSADKLVWPVRAGKNSGY